MKDIFTGLIRHALTVAGGALAAKGFAVGDSDIEVLSGALLAIVGVLWSVWSKRAKPAA